jgi:hypothetical protein
MIDTITKNYLRGQFVSYQVTYINSNMVKSVPLNPENSDYHPQTAPTTAPTAKHKNPRARKIAYSSSAGKLVVRFWDGTWWEYNGVTADTWNELKSSNSTGGFLWNNGFDQRNRSVGLKYPNSGIFNPDDMPPEVRVLFNEN